MSTLVSTLTLDGFDALPSHDRRCTFWTTVGDADAEGAGFADPEFEKEAWLSMVMLEWGACGQVATDRGTPAGCALYAPPGAVPRAPWFPTAPVSPDAVLLTSLGIAGSSSVGSPEDADELRTTLLQAVVRDLINRGVRALETFGITDPSGAAPAGAGCTPERCMTDATFLEKYGFEVVAAHHRFPRLRLELDRDHGWKEDVEAALERLLASAAITMTDADARVPVGVA